MLAVSKKKEFNYKKSKPNDRFVFRSIQAFYALSDRTFNCCNTWRKKTNREEILIEFGDSYLIVKCI